MKKVFLGVVLAAVLNACGNDHSDNKSGVQERDVNQVSSGLILEVKNSLPEEQIGNKRVKPDLNAYFCSPLSSDEKRAPKDRCVRLDGVVENGKVGFFIVPQSVVDQVSARGRGEASFEFSDNFQTTSISWPCYSPNHKVTLQDSASRAQRWHVEVNQRFTLSYGCLVR